jgi:Zn-dependent protease with chaperone function
MSLSALAGFVLVFVVTVVSTSALGGLMLATFGSRLQRVGPMVERRVAVVVAISPVVIATLVIGALVLQSSVGVDHCEVHDHHAHLCFTHGAQWIERTWVVVLLAIATAVVLARATILATSYLVGARSVRVLRAMSHARGEVRVVESDRAFCFVARDGVFVSSTVWTTLPGRQRAALVAHEEAHARNGDLTKRLMIEILLVFAAPFTAERVRGRWLRASERLCDAHAARVTDPETVANAMVSMCKLGNTQPVPGLAFTPMARDLAGRIEAVLASGSLGERAARSIGRVAIIGLISLAAAGGLAAEPLHHAFETLLG